MKSRAITWALLVVGIAISDHGYQSSLAQTKKELTVPPIVRSAKSGSWSDPATWEGEKLPPAGARVHVRSGHRVLYDLKSDNVIRSIHVAGTLTFARDRDTRLD